VLAREGPRDVAALAGELVRYGRLTAYQAAAVLQAKTKGLLIGNYDVLDKLGAGSMGMVFKARHRRLKRMVALKLMGEVIAGDLRDHDLGFERCSLNLEIVVLAARVARPRPELSKQGVGTDGTKVNYAFRRRGRGPAIRRRGHGTRGRGPSGEKRGGIMSLESGRRPGSNQRSFKSSSRYRTCDRFRTATFSSNATFACFHSA